MKLLFGILNIKLNSVARGKVTRGKVARCYVTARYCRRGSVAEPQIL
jgi:hypothetical protein